MNVYLNGELITDKVIEQYRKELAWAENHPLKGSPEHEQEMQDMANDLVYAISPVE